MASPTANLFIRRCFSLLVLVVCVNGWINVEAASLPDQQQCRDLWQKKAAIKPEIEGWCLTIDQARGNCLACHHIQTSAWPATLGYSGNAGPVLKNIAQTYSDRNELKAIVYDASVINPGTLMPPYGKNQILNESEIDLISKFLLSL